MHGYNETTYKQHFGIPYGVALKSEPTLEKHRAAFNKRNDVPGPGFPEGVERPRGKDFRKTVSSVVNQRCARILEERIYVACHCCGSEVSPSRAAGVLCEQCKKPKPDAGYNRAKSRRHYYRDIEHSRMLLRLRAARRKFVKVAESARWEDDGGAV